MHPLFLVPALLAAPTQAQEVLVPEFTPVIADDFTLAYMFYSLVVDELRIRDVDFADGDNLRRIAGADADNCGESITCPSGLWSFYPDSNIALVGTVGLYNAGTAAESIEVRVAFYERDGYLPLKTVERTIEPGGESDFAVALAKATVVLAERARASQRPEPVADVEPGPEGRRAGLLGRAGRRDETEDPEELTPQDELYKSYYAVDEPAEDRRSGRDDKEPRTREPREHDLGRVSTRPAREPREPRQRREPSGEEHLLQAQAFAGLAVGDVGRSYDLRLSVMGAANSQLGRYEHDAFVSGAGLELGVGLAVAPTSWLRAGARLGIVTGRKYLSTGYERWSAGAQSSVELQDYKPAAAMRGLLEPRVAVAPVALGAFRPSVHAFFGVRRYDAFEVTDLNELELPDRNGGWQLLPGAGLGLAYDLGSGRGLALDISHAVRLGADEVHHVQQGLITEIPEIPDPASRTTSVTVGFTQGFM